MTDVSWTHSKLPPEEIRSITTAAENVRAQDEKQGSPPLFLQVFEGTSVQQAARIMEDMAFLNGRDIEDHKTSTHISAHNTHEGSDRATLTVSNGVQIEVKDASPAAQWLLGDKRVSYSYEDFRTGKYLELKPSGTVRTTIPGLG